MGDLFGTMLDIWLKVIKSQKQFIFSSILPKKNETITILNKEAAQDIEFCSFFGRIEEP